MKTTNLPNEEGRRGAIAASQALLTPDAIVRHASVIIDEHEDDTERALALAIALRDRIESEEDHDRTAAILAGMIVEHLAGAPGNSIKAGLEALRERCNQPGSKSQ